MSIPTQFLPKETGKNIPVPSDRSPSTESTISKTEKHPDQNSEAPTGYREKLEKSLKDLDKSAEPTQNDEKVSNESDIEKANVDQSTAQSENTNSLPEISVETDANQILPIKTESTSNEQTTDSNHESQNLKSISSNDISTEEIALEETIASKNQTSEDKSDQPPGSFQVALDIKTEREQNASKSISSKNKEQQPNSEALKPPASLSNALNNRKQSENQSTEVNLNSVEKATLSDNNQHSQPNESEKTEAVKINNVVPKVDNHQNEKTPESVSHNKENSKNNVVENQQTTPQNNQSQAQLTTTTQNVEANNQNTNTTQKADNASIKPATQNSYHVPSVENSNPNTKNQTQLKSTTTTNIKPEQPTTPNQETASSQTTQQSSIPKVDSPKPEINFEPKKEIEITQSNSKSTPDNTVAPAEPRNVETVFTKQNSEAKVTAERIIDQVAQSVQKAADAGKVFKVRLDPPELGVLQIELTKVNGTIVARIETETASTQRLVLENIAQLKETLAQQGNPIDKIDVEWNQRGFEEESSNRQFNQTNSDKNQSDKNTNAQKVSSNSETQADQEADEADNKNEKPTLIRHDEIMTGLDIKI